MKKVFLLAIVLISTNVILAQTEKGKTVLSGATGLQFISSNIEFEYDGQSNGDYDINSFSFTSGVGYFVVDNLAIGLSANYSSTTQKDEGDKYTVSSTMLLPTALYYFPVDGQFKPLIQVGAGLMSTKEKESWDGDSDEFKMSGLAISFGGGASYFINDYVSLNFGLSYTIADLKDSDDSDFVQKQKNLAANIGFSVFL